MEVLARAFANGEHVSTQPDVARLSRTPGLTADVHPQGWVQGEGRAWGLPDDDGLDDAD
jgi:hypothetical protein